MTLRSISLSHYFFYETQIYISQFSLEHFLPREYFFRDLKFNIPPSEAHQFPLQATHLHWFLISDNSFTTYHIVQMRNLSISFGSSYSPLLLSRQALSVLCNLHSCAHCLGPGPSVRCPSLGLKIWGKWYRVKGVYNLFVVVPEAAVRVRGPLETVSHSVAFLGWYLTSSISWFPSNFWAWSSSLPVYPLYVLNYSDRFLFCHLFRVDSGYLQPGVLVDPRSNWNSWNTEKKKAEESSKGRDMWAPCSGVWPLMRWRHYQSHSDGCGISRGGRPSSCWDSFSFGPLFLNSHYLWQRLCPWPNFGQAPLSPLCHSSASFLAQCVAWKAPVLARILLSQHRKNPLPWISNQVPLVIFYPVTPDYCL